MNRRQKEKKPMDTITLALAVVATVLMVIAISRGRGVALAGFKSAGNTLWRNLPILLLGFIIAGLIHALIPRQVIVKWLGHRSGGKGILIGCVAGGLMPGSPYAVFPMVAALYRGGASMGAVVGFVTAWSLWSVVRLPMEVALIDPRVAVVRYIVTFAVPPVAGLLAQAVSRLL